MEILAKSSGITLAEHTANVVSEGNKIIENYPFVMEKYKTITGRDLIKRLLSACKFHDVGKKHFKWQGACQKDYQLFLDWQVKNGGDYRAYEKAVQHTGPNLMKANVRHEIESILRCPNLPLPVRVAIGAHHRKLAQQHKEKWINNENIGHEGKKAWAEFDKLGKDYGMKIPTPFKEILIKHYEIAGIRSLLQLADHRASIAENANFIPEYIPFNYHFPDSWIKRPVQQIAEENWQDELLLIRAPTGAGKTAASLLWATKQIEHHRADRLIIAMPTRFTSNALAINVTHSLSDTGLYHSSAWYQKFHEKAKENKSAQHEAKMYHEFARRLQTPVTVCTIDHLLMCLTLSREDHHAIAFNLAHSCLVIDEADFYDDFTQANILVLLEALKEWKVPVMIMSASLPESSLKMYQSIGFEVQQIKEDDSDYERPRCNIGSIHPYAQVSELSELLFQCIQQPTIIYANTVAKAFEFYDWFLNNTPIKPILYHSRFTEPDKLEKEKVLIENLGRKAWEQGKAQGVAILTQIGEMSINISADLMISDVCPIDRLVQRAGRLSRFKTTSIGTLHVLIPQKEVKEIRHLYPAPYGQLEKGKWTPSPALVKTINTLQTQPYTAREFVKLIDSVYEKLEEFSESANANARKLKENFTTNWVILPNAQSGEDELETLSWKSRNIGNQATVLTRLPDNPYYTNYIDWQAFLNEHSVSLPIYLIRKGMILYKIAHEEKIFLRGEPQKVFYALPEVYKSEFGLFFKKETIKDQIL